VSDLPPIPLIVRTRLAHATLQAIADACGADLLHIKGAAVDPSLLPTRPDAPADATAEERVLPRLSADADVLVRPAHLKRFQAALKRYGWQRKTRLYSGGAVEHSEDWWHPELGSADLHVRFPGIQLRRDQAFEGLWSVRNSLDLAHRPCPVPSVDAQRLLLLLHAARNGALGPADVRLAWSSATPTEQGRVQALAVRLQAEVALAAATGHLEDYADRVEYALWRIASLPDPNAFEAWLAHMNASTSIVDRARAFFYPFSFKADRLEVSLQRRPSPIEVLCLHVSRLTRGTSQLLALGRTRAIWRRNAPPQTRPRQPSS